MTEPADQAQSRERWTPPSGWERWAAAGLTAMTVIQQAVWVHLSTAAETWDDDAGLYRLATCIEEGLGGQATACFVGAPYPPLIPSIAAAHFWISGSRTLEVALHSLWIWPVVLCAALYFGLHRSAGRWAAVAGVAMGPVVVWSLHIRGKFYTEVPLAALVVASIVAWVSCAGFRHRKPSALLGLFLGLGLLCKWSFAFFLAPPMAIAWAIGMGGPARGAALRWGIGTVVVVAVAALGLGAAGYWSPGLVVAPSLCAGLGLGLVWVHRRWPERITADAGHRWLNVGVASAVLLIVAGPWYLSHVTGLQAFLADNLSQRFHGDAISPIEGLPFYPAVLLTRVLGVPLAGLFLLGVARVAGPRRQALAVWSLASLLAGTLILGILPYRAGRYLIAGFGLVTTLAVLAVARPRSIARIALPVLVGAGVTHQLSWIPLRAGWLHVPHHWPVFTLPERDLFGNSRQGISDSVVALLRPQWRFLPIASPPVGGTSAPRRIITAIRAHAGDTPFLAVVVDPQSKVNTNSLQSELLAARAPPTSEAVGGMVHPNRASIQHWQHQAQQPLNTPAAARLEHIPRMLYIATAHVHAADASPLTRLLSDLGWQRMLHDEIRDAFSQVDLTLWAEPGGQRR